MTQILVVEDNLDYAEEMAEFLIELEHDVHITNNASDMWIALSHGNVGVVVLDLGLPDEDGFNVIPRMRQLYPQIGLLVLTGRVAFDNRILGLRLALLPGVEFIVDNDDLPHPRVQGIDGAPL